MRTVGQHLLADLYGVEASILRDEAGLTRLFARALRDAAFTILKQASHRFEGGGGGVTGVFLLSASHLAFHTYPEYNYLALDVFSCTATDPTLVVQIVSKLLHPSLVDMHVSARGGSCPLQPGIKELANARHNGTVTCQESTTTIAGSSES